MSSSAEDFAVGSSRELVVAEELTRTQIVQYAGASGDFNPLHTDERYATEVAGFPSVFAHGMLTMGMTGRLLVDWFPHGELTRFGGRFVRQVWPGDRLTARAVVDTLDPGPDATVLSLTVTTSNQRDETVLAGYAEVTLRAR